MLRAVPLLLALAIADKHAPSRLAPLLRGHDLSAVIELNERFVQAKILDDGALRASAAVAVAPSAVNTTVSWSVTSPGSADFLALHCLMRDDGGALRSIGIADFVSTGTGVGSVELTLPELSCDGTELAYWQDLGSSKFLRRAVTALPRGATAGDDSTAPYHIRLAYADAPGSIFISWTSRANASAAPLRVC